MKIYLDVCCLNRPFDDLSQDRVYLEAEAVLSIISHCESGEWVLLFSDAIEYEISKLPDTEKYEQVQTLCAVAKHKIELDGQSETRAKFFSENGVKPLDSLHLALAEKGGANVFLTTDDQLYKAAKKINLKVKIDNPVNWLMGVINNERK